MGPEFKERFKRSKGLVGLRKFGTIQSETPMTRAKTQRRQGSEK